MDHHADEPHDDTDPTWIPKLLDPIYDLAVEGFPGFASAVDHAGAYRDAGATPAAQAASLVRWQTAKAAGSGFVLGLPGGLALPATIPASFASVTLIQLRMITAVAVLGGHDPKDERVRTLAYLCLLGRSAADVLKPLGIEVGRTLTHASVRHASRRIARRINRAVGYRLVSRAAETRLFRLHRALPVVGGVISGVWDGATTNAVGEVAIGAFVGEPIETVVV